MGIRNTNLARCFDAVDKTEKHQDPGSQQAQYQLPLEPSNVGATAAHHHYAMSEKCCLL